MKSTRQVDLDLPHLGQVWAALGEARWDGRTEGRWYIDVIFDHEHSLKPEIGPLTRTFFLTTENRFFAQWEEKPYVVADHGSHIVFAMPMSPNTEDKDTTNPFHRSVLDQLRPHVTRHILAKDPVKGDGRVAEHLSALAAQERSALAKDEVEGEDVRE